MSRWTLLVTLPLYHNRPSGWSVWNRIWNSSCWLRRWKLSSNLLMSYTIHERPSNTSHLSPPGTGTGGVVVGVASSSCRILSVSSSRQDQPNISLKLIQKLWQNSVRINYENWKRSLNTFVLVLKLPTKHKSTVEIWEHTQISQRMWFKRFEGIGSV